MAEDYKHITQQRPVVKRRTTHLGHLLSAAIGLAIGCLATGLFYTMDDNTMDDNSLPHDHSDDRPAKTMPKDNLKSASHQAPEPMFHFYKILPSHEIKVPGWGTINRPISHALGRHGTEWPISHALDGPETDGPTTDGPETEQPISHAPDGPETDGPTTDGPETERPISHAPDGPETDGPTTDGRETERPISHAPDGPETDGPTTDGPEIEVAEWLTLDEAPTHAINNQGQPLILQVGSFQDYARADKLKARLAMLGIRADIKKVTVNNGQDIRYRVRSGPYNNPEELQQIQRLLHEHRLTPMVLKRFNI